MKNLSPNPGSGQVVVAMTLALVLLTLAEAAWAAGDRTLTFQNNCSETVWIGAVGGYTQECDSGQCPPGQACFTRRVPPGCFWVLPTPSVGDFKLIAGGTATIQLTAPPQGTIKWSGNVYGRTGCDSKGENCQTGPCPGGPCPPGVGPVGPVTLAEFTLVANIEDTYDVSMINGVNVPMEMAPSPGQALAPPPPPPKDDYWCGNPGAVTPSNPALTGCSWEFHPVISGVDQSAVLQMVTPGGKSCTKNSDCSPPEVCGLSMVVGTTTVNQNCGNQIGWWTADEVCGFTASSYGPPFNCSTPVPNQGTEANLYLCNGPNSQSCYTPGATSKCCGCPNWHLPGEMTCQSSNPSWVAIAEPWAKFVKDACPMGYSFPFDDSTSTFTCETIGTSSQNPNHTNYTITYCPGRRAGR